MENISTTVIDVTHHIQRQVMVQLRQKEDQTYQSLKPDGVEGNAFNYHLRLLKKAGLIKSHNSLYSLTPKGTLVTDGFSSSSGRLMMRPYAYNALLVTSADKVLLYKSERLPLKDIYCLPIGKMRYGEDLGVSVAREAARRNLVGNYDSISLCPINIRFLRRGEVVVHRPGHLWHLEYHGALERSVTSNGVGDWYDKDSLAELGIVAPDVTEGLRRITAKSHNPIDIAWEIPG